jgi:hypothetical protein
VITEDQLTELAHEPAVAVPAPSRSRARLPIAAVALSAVLGLAGGFVGSALHHGPAGSRGPAGPQGVAGPAGPAGPAGAAAQVAELGVCYSTYSNTSGTASWISGVYLTSPSRHTDGTTYCPSGSYVPVAPQAPNAGPPGE